MSSIIIKSFIIFLFVFFPFTANSKKCYKEDFINFVSDHVGCIAINIHEDENFDITKSNKNKLIIFIHGDSINHFSKGKPVFRTGLNYQVDQATYVRCSWGQGYRFPSVARSIF